MIRRPNSHPSWFNRYDRALREIVPVAIERYCCDPALLFSATIHESNDADMRLLEHNGQFTEVFIQRDQNLGVLERVRQHFVVPGITRPAGSRLDVVSGSAKGFLSPAPDTAVEKNLHTSTLGQCWFDAFVPDQPSGIDKAGSDVVRLEPGVTLQDDLRGVSGREHAKHVLDCQPMPPNNGLAPKDRRVGRNASEHLVIASRTVLVHGRTQMLTHRGLTRSERFSITEITSSNSAEAFR